MAALYAQDVHHRRARALLDALAAQGHSAVLVDFLVYEAVSVLCRRAEQRRTAPPDLKAALTVVRSWFAEGYVRFLAHEAEQRVLDVLDVVQGSDAVPNFNDALLVVLAREGLLDNVASFDGDFAHVPGFPLV